MRRIRFIHVLNGDIDRLQGEPYILDVRTFDIPNTIAMMIRNAPPGLVAVSLRPLGGGRMIASAEREARHRGARVIWLPPGRAVVP